MFPSNILRTVNIRVKKTNVIGLMFLLNQLPCFISASQRADTSAWAACSAFINTSSNACLASAFSFLEVCRLSMILPTSFMVSPPNSVPAAFVIPANNPITLLLNHPHVLIILYHLQRC